MPSLLTELGLKGFDATKLTFIRSGVLSGLSGNSIQAALTASPLGGVRRSVLQTVISAIKGVVPGSRGQIPVRNVRGKIIRPRRTFGQEYVKRVRYDYKLDVGRLEKSIYEHEHDYNYIIEVKGHDKYTGQRLTQHITITTNTLITKGDAIGYARDYGYVDDYNFDPDTVEMKVKNVVLGGQYL